jgi:hypothetical protein
MVMNNAMAATWMMYMCELKNSARGDRPLKYAAQKPAA